MGHLSKPERGGGMNSNDVRAVRDTNNGTLQQKVLRLVFSENSFLLLRIALSGVLGKAIHSLYRRRERILPYLTRCWNIVRDNPFLTALLGGSILATPAALIRYILSPVWAYIRSFFVASVTIESSDPSFLKVRDYIMKTPHFGVAADTNLKAETKKKKWNWKDWRSEAAGTLLKKVPEMTYSSDSGQAIHIMYKHTHLSVYISKHGQAQVVGRDKQLMQPYRIYITTMGRDGVGVIKQFITDALRHDLHLDDTDTTNIYVSSNHWWMGRWQKAMEKQKRDKTTVVLDEDLSDKLVQDAKRFLASSEWYSKRGVPFRRGYLLHGPPGTGKTSFCQVLAGELDADLCLLTLTDAELTDTGLAESMREAPRGSIILLEDVDAVFVDRQDAGEKKNSNGVSFSGLLNAIDGVASQEGRIFIMTTNHIEKLDNALKRPGRCDVTVKLDFASRSQMVRLFTRFYAKAERDEANDQTQTFSMKERERMNGGTGRANKIHGGGGSRRVYVSPRLLKLGKTFSMMLPENELSMAKLSGYLMQQETPEDALAVKNIQELLQVSQEKQILTNKSIYEHFRRVGLEHLTPYFEANHYRFQHDLKRLDDVKLCKSWCWELEYDDRAFKRLKHLLCNDPAMKEEYQTATIATIRDAFLAQFAVNRMVETSNDFSSMCKDEGNEASSVGTSPLAEEGNMMTAPKLRRLNTDELKSSNLILTPAKRNEGAASNKNNCIRNEFLAMELSRHIQTLAQDLIEAVSRNGKVEISLWQLRWLLSQFDNPDDLILAAKNICSPRPLESFHVETLSTRKWLKWIGMTKYIHHFEEKGGMSTYESVKESLAEGDGMLRKIRISPDDRAFIMKLIKNKEEHRSQTSGILRPYKSHVANMFWSHYADKYGELCGGKHELVGAASFFSKQVCDVYGRSTVSTIELKKYFKAHSEKFEDALKNCKSVLLKTRVPPKEKPPSPTRPPTHWVYKALRNDVGDLEKTVSESLESADIKTKDDLLAKPSLSLEEMKAIGITKLGLAKRLYRLIQKLQRAEECGSLNKACAIPEKGDLVETPYGLGEVLAFIEDDDMYRIKLCFGEVYISDAESKVASYFKKHSATMKKKEVAVPTKTKEKEGNSVLSGSHREERKCTHASERFGTFTSPYISTLH